MTSRLVFLAGKQAYQKIKSGGLSPGDVKTIAGAAGGPKWLVLNRLDRILFGTWLKDRTKPLYLIGSSIGAWRFAAMCQSDPMDAQQRFEDAYIYQQYSSKPSPSEITRESLKIMHAFVNEKSKEEILHHPVYQLGFLSVRCKWPSSSDKTPLLSLGLLLAALGNLAARPLLRLQFERVLFHRPDATPPYDLTYPFPTQTIALNQQNFDKALLASGSIPLVMEGMRKIPDVPAGTYRDGGLVDYHLDIPFQVDSHEIVLYPHFTERVVPGWLDKALKWRKPHAEYLKNVLLVAPSRDYIEKLPNGKIPDRNDFYLYKGRDKDRFRDWTAVVTNGEDLAAEFLDTVESGRIKQMVKPFENLR